MHVHRIHASPTLAAPVLLPESNTNTANRTVNTTTDGGDRFVRPTNLTAARRARLNEINAKHPKLDEEIKDAKTQAEAATKRASWKGLKWYEKSLLIALPFGALALVGIMDTLRMHADDANGKVDQLVNLRRERDSLRS